MIDVVDDEAVELPAVPDDGAVEELATIEPIQRPANSRWEQAWEQQSPSSAVLG